MQAKHVFSHWTMSQVPTSDEFLIPILLLNYVGEVCARNCRSPQEREEDIGSPVAGDTGRYEPPDTDARDPTWVLYSELF